MIFQMGFEATNIKKYVIRLHACWSSLKLPAKGILSSKEPIPKHRFLRIVQKNSILFFKYSPYLYNNDLDRREDILCIFIYSN